jgi:hypothetical protein
MAAQAAHLVGLRVCRRCRFGQFVLSFPFELSLLAATKPEVLRGLARIHAELLRDPAAAPTRIFVRHPNDQLDDLGRDRRSANAL